jgi:hypothetical protein
VPATNSVPGRISTQTTLASEKGFDLRITAGNTDGCTVPGGDMYLSAGVGYNGISHGAGNVNIVTGDRYGNVTGNIWRFDSSGALTLPLGSATIKNTAGNAVAFGLNAGLTSQGANAVAIGINSGVYSQSANAVAVGTLAGNGGRVTTNYVSGAVSPSTTLVVTSTTGIVPGMVITGTGFFGTITVVTVTNSTTLEISASAVFTPSGALNFTGSQGDNSVAIGTQAGQVQQGQFAVAIGDNAGNSGQGTDAVAIGASAGLNTQGAGAVAFGQGTGETSQGANAVAIGKAAGQVNQGINSIAIGQSAGLTNQGNNSIILNATGAALDQTTANTFTVAPVRNDVANIGPSHVSKEITYGNVISVAVYNATSKEITYGNVISVAGNITGGKLPHLRSYVCRQQVLVGFFLWYFYEQVQTILLAVEPFFWQSLNKRPILPGHNVYCNVLGLLLLVDCLDRSDCDCHLYDEFRIYVLDDQMGLGHSVVRISCDN